VLNIGHTAWKRAVSRQMLALVISNGIPGAMGADVVASAPHSVQEGGGPGKTRPFGRGGRIR
jgi:hypothetical protein